MVGCFGGWGGGVLWWLGWWGCRVVGGAVVGWLVVGWWFLVITVSHPTFCCVGVGFVVEVGVWL